MSEPTISVRLLAARAPELVQWVVQRHGPQPEEWTEAQFMAFYNWYSGGEA